MCSFSEKLLVMPNIHSASLDIPQMILPKKDQQLYFFWGGYIFFLGGGGDLVTVYTAAPSHASSQELVCESAAGQICPT